MFSLLDIKQYQHKSSATSLDEEQKNSLIKNAVESMSGKSEVVPVILSNSSFLLSSKVMMNNSECHHTLFSYLWSLYLQLIKIMDAEHKTEKQALARQRSRYAQEQSKIFISEDEQLVILQLCLAKINKEESGDFEATLSSVLHAQHCLIQRKLKTKKEACNDKYSAVFKEYDDYLKNCKLLDALDVWNSLISVFQKETHMHSILANKIANNILLLEKKPESKMQMEILTKLIYFLQKHFMLTSIENEMQWCEVSSDELNQQVMSLFLKQRQISGSGATTATRTPRTPYLQNSASMENYLFSVMICYLRLLLNTKDELALAITFNIPERGLGQKAFTAVKHLSLMNSLPLCQTVISFVRSSELANNRNSLSESDNDLNNYLEGLKQWENLHNKLINFITDIQEPKECFTKIINTLKHTFTKHADTSKLKLVPIQKCAAKLLAACDTVLKYYPDINNGRELVWLLVNFESCKTASVGTDVCFTLQDHFLTLTPTPTTSTPASKKHSVSIQSTPNRTPNNRNKIVPVQSILSKYKTPESSFTEKADHEECDNAKPRMSLEEQVMVKMGLPLEQETVSIVYKNKTKSSSCDTQFWAVDENSLQLDDEVKSSVKVYKKCQLLQPQLSVNNTQQDKGSNNKRKASIKNGEQLSKITDDGEKKSKKHAVSKNSDGERKGKKIADANNHGHSTKSLVKGKGGKTSTTILKPGQKNLFNYFRKS